MAIQKQAHTIRLPKNQDWKEFKVGKVPMAANVKLTNIYSDVVKDGQRRGGVLATIRVYFDAEDLLETIFWKVPVTRRETGNGRIRGSIIMTIRKLFDL